jgi:hypothetical protein
MYRFKVTYDIKHINKTSTLNGLLTPETCKFDTLQDAIKFVRVMHGRRTNKYEVVGMPVIERITINA